MMELRDQQEFNAVVWQPPRRKQTHVMHFSCLRKIGVLALGLQSGVLYSLPELVGAIDTVILGGILVGI